MNASATVVTNNVKHFQTARDALGLPVMKPTEAVLALAEEGE